MSKIIKIIDERETQKRSYREWVRDMWFCWAFKLGFLILICKASLIFKSNLELVLSIILKERESYEPKHVAVECRCLKIWDLLPFLIYSSILVSTSKYIYQERFQIIRDWVFMWKIIFNFEWSKNYLMLTFYLQNSLQSFESLFLIWCDRLLIYGNLK